MANYLGGLFSRTYKILLVLAVVILFFFLYNRYLVDRSMYNLRFVLDKVDEVRNIDDARKLAKILDLSLLMEIAAREMPAASLAKIEIAKDILSRPEEMSRIEKDAQKMASALHSSLMEEVGSQEVGSSVPVIESAQDILTKLQIMSQVEDAKFALKEAIDLKEKQRNPLLVFLDKISQAIAPNVKKASAAELLNREDALKKRLSLTEDKATLQELYYELAGIYSQLSEFSKAKESYQKAIEISPQAKLAQKSQFNSAWVDKLQGNLDAAATEFEKLAQTAKEEDLGVFSLYQMADTLRKKGDYEKALNVYQQIVDEQPGMDLAQITTLQIGQTYLYDMKDYERAEQSLEESKERFKDSNIAQHIEKVSISSLVTQYRLDGFRLLERGYRSADFAKYNEALTKFDRALEVNPDDGISYTGKALAFLWLNRPDTALSSARRAIKFMPQEEIASVNLGYIYIRLDMVEEAIIEYKRFLALNPRTSLGYYNLGYAYALRSRLEEAAFAFSEATKLDPLFAFAYNNLGWCYWKLGKYAQARGAFEKALQTQGRFSEAVYNLGLVYKSIGKYEEAERQFEEVLSINPQYPGAEKQLRETKQITSK